jgi:hypothetical protein
MSHVEIKYGHSILTPRNQTLAFKDATCVSDPDLLTEGAGYRGLGDFNSDGVRPFWRHVVLVIWGICLSIKKEMAAPPLPMIAINLDRRTDRWSALTEAFADYPIERFSAIRPADGDGIRGCRESHFAALRLARERQYPWVALMEDDCVPYSHFREELARLLPLLWELRASWDIYTGGPIALRSMTRIKHNLIGIDFWACAQFIIIHAGAYNKILNGWNETTSMHAVDMYYNNTLRSVTSAPPLTYQSNTPSDVQTDHTIGATDEFRRAYLRVKPFEVTDLAPSSVPASAGRTPLYAGAGRRK